jgi:glucokinase
MDTYIGIVLGGTKIMIGEIDGQGNILSMKRYKSGFFNQESASEIIRASLDDYRSNVHWKEHPCAIGVGLIGRVDSERGIWHQIDPDLTNPIALASEFSAIYGMPCFIDNDVKAATRAVIKWGFGQISRDFIYIYVGTGIAASMVVEGKQIRGSHFNAGEVGHLRVGVQVGIKCPCGRTDCVETIASSVGIDRCARYLKNYYPTHLMIPDRDGRVSVEEVFRLSQEGDALCEKLVDNATEALANLIMNMVRISDPDTVVLGGEMVADGFLLGKVQEKLQSVTMRFVTNGVVITKLNPQFISLLGAAAVAIDGLSSTSAK